MARLIRSRLRNNALLLLIAATSAAAAAQNTIPLRYTLIPGDHLIYRETIERTVNSAKDEQSARYTFTSHVIVLGPEQGGLAIAIQRRRETGTLLSARTNGHDAMRTELPEFNKRLAQRPQVFAETNVVEPSTGVALAAWQVTREVSSKVLFAIHEIEPLPSNIAEAKPGATWTSESSQLAMRVESVERIDNQDCARITGSGRSGDILHYTLCAPLGAVQRLEVTPTYSTYGATVHEKITFELIEKRTDESVGQWITAPDTQQAVLTALLNWEGLPVDPRRLTTLAEVSNARVQALALAVMFRRQLSLDPAVVAKLAASGDAELRTIATRFAGSEPPRPPAFCPDVKPAILRQQMTGTYFRNTKDGHPYIVRVPNNYRPDQPYPVLFYLSGGDGMALDGALTAESALRPTDYVAVYPQAADLWWNPGPTASFSKLMDEVLAEFHADTDRVYIAGFSNGGGGALYYATLWPQRFAAVASLMGQGAFVFKDKQLPLKNVANVAVLLVHGDNDPLVNVQITERTSELLRAISPRVAPEVHILKGREHDITLVADDGLTLRFLEKQSRVPLPPKISAKIEPGFPRQYWLESEGDKEADVQASAATGIIDVHAKGTKALRLLLRPELARGAVRIRVNGKYMSPQEVAVDCNVFAESIKKTHDPQLGWTHVVELDVK